MAGPRRWRRLLGKLLRGLVYGLLLIVLLLIGTLFLLRRPAGLDLLRRQVLERTRAIVPGLSLQRIEGDLTSTLTLHGVVLNDRFGGPAIRVRRIALRYQLRRLLGGVIKVEQLELDQPEVQVRPSRNGALNLSQLVVPSPEQEPPSEPTTLRLELQRLRLRRGQLEVASQPRPLQVSGLEVDLGLEGGVSDARLQLRRLAARLQLPDGRRLQASLSGRAAIDAEKLETRLDAEIAGLLPSTGLKLGLRARGPHRRVQLGLRLQAPGKGLVTVDGWGGLDGAGRPSYALTTRVSGLDPGELIPALRPIRLDLELEAAGQGVPLQPGSSARLALRVPPVTVRGLRLQAISLRARTRDASWTLEKLLVKAAGGRITASGQGGLERGEASAEIDLPRLDRLPAAVRQLGVPRLAGSVKLSARVSGPWQGPLSVRSTMRLRSIALDALKLQRGELSAKLDGLPAAPAGQLSLRIEGLDPGDARLKVDRAELLVSGDPRRLRLSTELSGPSLRASLLTDAKVAAGGKRIEAWLRRLELEGLGHKLGLRNQPRLIYQPAGLELASTRLALLGGEVTAAGSFRPRGFPRLTASLKVDGVRPPGFAHPVHAAVEARLDRREVRASVLGELRTLGSRLQLIARLPVRYRGTMPAPDLGGEGEAELRLSGLQLALLRELRPDLPETSGEVGLALDLKGPLKDPELKLDLQVQKAGFAELRDVDGRTQLEVSAGRSSLRQRASLAGRPLLTLEALLPVGLGPFLKGTAPSWEPHRELPLDLHLTVLPTSIGSLPYLQPLLQRFAGTASARIDLTGSMARPRLQVQSRIAGSVVEGRKLGELALQGDLQAGARSLRLKLGLQRDRLPLVNVQGSAGLQLEALLGLSPATRPRPLRVPLDVAVELPGYPLDRLASIDPGLEGLRGKLRGKIQLRGDTQAPRARATLEIGQLGYGKVPVGDLGLEAALDERWLDASLALRQPGGGLLRGKARLPLRPGPGLNASLKGQRLDLAFLSRLSPALQESAGKLAVEVRAEGSLARPVLEGSIRLEEGLLHLRGLSPLHHLQARIDLTPDRVRLSRLVLRGDRGAIEASGQVQLTTRGLELARGAGLLRHAELQARASKFGLDAGGVTGVVFSGTVKTDARLEGKRVAVKVSVEDGVVRMPKIKGQNTHPTALPPDLVFVERSPSTGPARAAARQSPLGFQLDLQADPLFVRGEQLDIELANQLHLRSDRQGRPRIRGSVQIRRGRIWVLKNTFEVRRAIVRFSGELDPDPALDILLERAAPEAAVLVQVTGTARTPELTLRSDPPIYDQSQILSLLLTGRVDSRPDAGGGDQTMAVAGAISGVLLGGILQSVAPRVGLDVARVSFDEAKDKKTGESQLRAEAEVGRYITERIYIGYRRVFGASAEENTNEGLMEYRISTRWLLMALFGDAGVGGLDLLWNFRH